MIAQGAHGILHLGRQARGPHVKAQMDGAGHLIDVLAARALGADHAERQVAFVDIQGILDMKHRAGVYTK
ncbi:hypothetical protein D3C78_1803570 [compost metagenome]